MNTSLPTPRALEAAPVDARVGQARMTYKRSGTVLRAEPKLTGPVVGAKLPKHTTLHVEEVNLPWLKVRATTAAGTVSGYLRAFETVEPSALQGNPPAAPGGRASGAHVTAAEASAAGRQFDRTIERKLPQHAPGLAYRLRPARSYRADHRWDGPGRGHRVPDGRAPGPPGSGLLSPWTSRWRSAATQYLWRAPWFHATPAPTSQRRPAGTRWTRRVLDKGLDEIGVDKDFRRAARGAFEGIRNAERERAKQLSERFTAEQEYWVGRAVAAQAIAQYGLDPDQGRQAYVRLVGEALVRASNRVRPNFGGYHFIVLNSDEINGLSGPGGFICVTRGAVMACQTEDDLAGILGHELGHVTLKHGERVLRQQPAFKTQMSALVGFVGGLLGNQGWEGKLAGQLVKAFSVSVTESYKIAAQNGYGRSLEFAADLEGTYLLVDVFYDHEALRNMLLRLPQHGGSATHASPMVRAQALQPHIARYRPFTPREGVKEARLGRFQARGLGGRASSYVSCACEAPRPRTPLLRALEEGARGAQSAARLPASSSAAMRVRARRSDRAACVRPEGPSFLASGGCASGDRRCGVR